MLTKILTIIYNFFKKKNYKPNYIDSNQSHPLTNHRYTTTLTIQYKKIKNIQKHLDEMTHVYLF
jgi:hypothetical protein